MKKIGLLISTLNSGGAERVVSRLTKILAEEYEIFLILFEDTYINYEYEGKLINLDIKSSDSLIKQLLLPFFRARKMKKIKKKFKLDLVISFLDSPNIVNILSKTRECKTIVSVRNYIAKEQKQNIRTKIIGNSIKFLYNKADKIIAVSQLIKKSLIDDYKIKEEKIEVIYNPYNLKEIEQLTKEKIEKQYMNFMDSEKIFISVGRQMHQKGFWHLIKAFKIVNEKYKDAKLIIIGKDYQNGKVDRIIKEMKLKDNVLLTGYNSNPFKFIGKCYAYVLTSIFEGFPNALVEAMCCGVPVISVDCKSGPREILDSNANINKQIFDIEYSKYGILVPEMNGEENWDITIFENSEKILADAMINILENKDIHLNYMQQSLVRSKVFSNEVCREKYVKLIEEVLDHKRRS